MRAPGPLRAPGLPRVPGPPPGNGAPCGHRHSLGTGTPRARAPAPPMGTGTPGRRDPPSRLRDSPCPGGAATSRSALQAGPGGVPAPVPVPPRPRRRRARAAGTGRGQGAAGAAGAAGKLEVPNLRSLTSPPRRGHLHPSHPPLPPPSRGGGRAVGSARGFGVRTLHRFAFFFFPQYFYFPLFFFHFNFLKKIMKKPLPRAKAVAARSKGPPARGRGPPGPHGGALPHGNGGGGAAPGGGGEGGRIWAGSSPVGGHGTLRGAAGARLGAPMLPQP